MKRSSLLLGITLSLVSMGAFAATKSATPAAEKPAATAPATKKAPAKKATKNTDKEKKAPATTEPSGS
jgi:hypothetical protein